MGQNTVEPEHKPEQRQEPEGHRDFDRLAVGLTVLVEMTRIYGQRYAPDHMTQGDNPFQSETGSMAVGEIAAEVTKPKAAFCMTSFWLS